MYYIVYNIITSYTSIYFLDISFYTRCQNDNTKRQLSISSVIPLSFHIHCVPKKEATKLSAITCSNLNRFSRLFHCWI